MSETTRTENNGTREVSKKTSARSVPLDHDDDADNDPTLIDLGTRVKTLRRERKLTLEALSTRSGVSRAMLSKVERAEKSPTLSIVVRIARGLGINLSDLLGAKPDQSEVSIIRAADRLVFNDPQSGLQREMLSPLHTNNGIEILMHRIPPGKSSGVLPAYAVPTEKYVMVQEGELTLNIGGKSYVVGEDDTIHFAIKSSYSFENHGSVPVSYYVVLVRSR